MKWLGLISATLAYFKQLGLGIGLGLVFSINITLFNLYFIHLYSLDGSTGRYHGALNVRLDVHSVRHTEPTTV